MLTTNAIRAAIDQKIIDIASIDPDIYVIPTNMESAKDLTTDDEALCKITINFGDIVDGEKGPTGAARRQCLLALNIFVLHNTGTGRILDVCEMFENTLHRLELITPSGDEIFFEDAYTDGGFLTETIKFCYVVKVPFWVWVGN